MTLDKQKIIIVGGTSGIGLATAELAKAQGAEVIATGLESSKADYTLNIEDEQAVKAFFEQVGEFDHVVITGGRVNTGAFLETPTGDVKIGMESKFWGQYYVAKYAAPHIRKNGSIVLFSGMAARRPQPGLSVMASVNGAVNSFGKALAVELAPIRVNVIAPGVVDTPRYDKMPADQKRAMVEGLSEKLLVKHVGEAHELAEAVVFAMSNTFLTGQVLSVDGGHQLV